MSGCRSEARMTESHTPEPWSVGRTGRPSTLAIFQETPTARQLVARFADHTVSYADVRLMCAAPTLLRLAEQAARKCPECGGHGIRRRTDFEGTPIDDVDCDACAEIRAAIAMARDDA